MIHSFLSSYLIIFKLLNDRCMHASGSNTQLTSNNNFHKNCILPNIFHGLNKPNHQLFTSAQSQMLTRDPVCAQIITIEPGVYIPPVPILKENAPDRYRGIGIRIEDEVLITESGHEVLSSLHSSIYNTAWTLDW